MSADLPTYDYLDELVDTDPIQLRNEAYAMRVRVEQAEATIARVRERLDALIAAGFGAVTDTLRALRDMLNWEDDVSSQQSTRHLGGNANAEDCPACDLRTMIYPYLCPGEETP